MRSVRSFEPHADQVVEARRFVISTLCGWGCCGHDVALLVSELATNAVLHARSDFSVRLVVRSGRIRVEVADHNSRLPTYAAVSPDAYSGRGLMLVQYLADDWGVDSHGSEGKTIWFEVPAERRPTAR